MLLLQYHHYIIIAAIIATVLVVFTAPITSISEGCQFVNKVIDVYLGLNIKAKLQKMN